MKKIYKIVLPCLIIFILVGCNLNNTPTSKVEERLSNYQMLDKSINILDRVQLLVEGDEIDEDQIDKYKKIVKKQYKKLSYNVKNESIDGNTAEVEVQIEVLDFKKVIEKLNKEVDRSLLEDIKYNDMKIDRLNDAKDMVTYTIVFTVNKGENGNWYLGELGSMDEQKILGIY